MSDRIADLEATIRAAIGAGDRLVPGTMSEAEFDALPAIAELVEIAARAVRAEAERDAANDVLQEFVDAWFEWEPGDDTEPLDRTAGRAMSHLGTVIALAGQEGKPE